MRVARETRALALPGAMIALAMVLGATSASAGPRDATIEQLRALASDSSPESVRVLVNDGIGAPLRVGDALSYRFESTRPGYLTAIHVDTYGATTLLFPRSEVEAGRLGGGTNPCCCPTRTTASLCRSNRLSGGMSSTRS